MTERHGGRILVDQLSIQGVERVFCIPGESYLAALDGLYDSEIRTVVCRQEGGASMMEWTDRHCRMFLRAISRRNICDSVGTAPSSSESILEIRS